MQFTSLLKNKEEAKISFDLIEGREKKPKEELHNLTEKAVSENSRNGMAESIIADPFGEIPGNLSGRGGMRKVDLDEDFGGLQAAQAEYSLAAVRAQAKIDISQFNETVQEAVSYDTLGNVRLIMTSRNGRQREIYLCRGLYSFNVRVLQPVFGRDRVIHFSYRHCTGTHELFVSCRKVKGGRVCEALTAAGVEFNLDVSLRKRILAMNQWLLSMASRSEISIVPIREGWFFFGDHAKHYTEEETWEGIVKKCIK